MNTDNKTNHRSDRMIFIQGAKDHFARIHDEYKSSFPKFEDFLKGHLFTATATFHPRAVSTFTRERVNPKLMENYHQPGVLDEFGRFYIRMVRFVVGANFKRKREFQPTAFIFIDFEGSSRAGVQAFLDRKNPHLHGPILVRPDHRDRFLEMIERRKEFMPASMDDLKIDPFDPARASVERAISYSAKGFLETPEQVWRSPNRRGKVLVHDYDRNDLWDMFPRLKV